LARVLAGALAAHVLWSALLSAALTAGYRHRVFDVRRWDGPWADTTELLARFASVRGRALGRRMVVFVGSSFTYGYAWQEPVIYSRRFAELRPDAAVINLSVIGADTTVSEWALCGLLRDRSSVDSVIIEIPVVNEAGKLSRQIATGAAVPLGATGACRAIESTTGYFGFFWRHPFGAGLLPFIWDDKAYPKPDAEIALPPVGDNYFVPRDRWAAIAPMFAARVEALARNARSLGRPVYVYPTPVFLPGVREVGRDARAVRAQIDLAIAACRRVPGVTCLDPEPFLDRRDCYWNMTHLNQRGHQAMAEWLHAVVPTAEAR
jgi:hypothetical protein